MSSSSKTVNYDNFVSYKEIFILPRNCQMAINRFFGKSKITGSFFILYKDVIEYIFIKTMFRLSHIYLNSILCCSMPVIQKLST